MKKKKDKDKDKKEYLFKCCKKCKENYSTCGSDPLSCIAEFMAYGMDSLYK